MQRNDILVLLFGAIILGALFIEPAQALQATNAFARIFVNGANVFNALSYNDYLSFKAGSGITLSVEPHTVIISTTAGPSGDTNTAQIGDQGTHLSIFGSRYNATKNLLKTFVCTGSATCSTNSTDIQIDVSAGATGYTKINNLDGGDAKVLATNTTLSNTQATFKTLTAGSGVTITNGSKTVTIAVTNTLKVDNQTARADRFMIGLNNSTGDWTTKIFSVDNQTVSKDLQIVGINNVTGAITTNQFSVNDLSTTCSANQFVSAISLTNTTGYTSTTCSSVTGLPVSLSGNLTTTSTAAFTPIFTIPLTANSGNVVQGVLVAESNTAGGAVQAAAHLSAATQTGWCNWVTPSSATANNLDNLVLSTTAAETGETTWLPAANIPQSIWFTCSIKGSGTPNLIIEFQAEVASTVKIDQGSYYIKSP